MDGIEDRTIPLEEVGFDSTSYVDPHGRLFRWRGSLYRGILPEHAGFFRGLLQAPPIQRLVGAGRLVESEVTDLRMDGFGLVLRHREIRPRTYCMEWPPEMLQAAGELTLEIALEANEAGLLLQDAYPWNVLFEGPRPVFVDLGSLSRAQPEDRFLWKAYQQFCNFFLFPMYLYTAGHHPIVRRLLYDYLNGVSYEQCSRLLPLWRKVLRPQTLSRLEAPLQISRLVRHLKIEHQVDRVARQGDRDETRPRVRRAFLQGLLRDMRALRVSAPEGVWSDYYEEWPAHDAEAEWNPKQETVASILRRLRPAQVLDVACNRGWYSLLAAREGSSVVGLDTDESSISWLYRRALQDRLDVQPLVMDLLNPTPAFGWRLRQFPSSLERLRAEMVFAFALIHHLVFDQWQDFERVVSLLDTLAEKWLLLEFVPVEDEKTRKLLAHHQREPFEWYTLEELDRVLARYFPHREVFESHPAGRKLILCGREALT